MAFCLAFFRGTELEKSIADVRGGDEATALRRLADLLRGVHSEFKAARRLGESAVEAAAKCQVGTHTHDRCKSVAACLIVGGMSCYCCFVLFFAAACACHARGNICVWKGRRFQFLCPPFSECWVWSATSCSGLIVTVFPWGELVQRSSLQQWLRSESTLSYPLSRPAFFSTAAESRSQWTSCLSIIGDTAPYVLGVFCAFPST